MKMSILDGAFFSVMVGLGETYFSAFVLALGLGEFYSGMVTVLPVMVGALIQLSAPRLSQELKTTKRWVVFCVSLQALSFLPLAYAAYSQTMSPIMLFASITLYWAAVMSAGPFWQKWMGEIIPERSRAEFFAERGRIMQAFVFAGILFGGIVLHYNFDRFSKAQNFIFLFLVAFLCRAISGYFLSQQSESKAPISEDHVGWKEFLKRIRKDDRTQVLAMLILFQATVQISGPYATAYMLSHLKLDYSSYMILLAVSFLAKIVVYPFLGRFIEVKSANRLLMVGVCGIAPLPICWLFSDHFFYLAFLQILTGIFWGCFELASFMMLFEVIPSKERAAVQSKYNLLNSIGMVVGSWVGGTLLSMGSNLRQGYENTYSVSTALRLAMVLMFLYALRKSTQRLLAKKSSEKIAI